MGFICVPCQVGGKEYKGYGEQPFAGVEANRRDVREMLLVQNDYEHARNKAGKENPKFIPFKELSQGNVHKIYEDAVPLQQFIQSNSESGNLLLMNFQLENKKDGTKGFILHSFHFKTLQATNFKSKVLRVSWRTYMVGN